MGAVSSDLTYDVKAQASALNNGAALYKYVGMSGDGELVRLMRMALKTKNFNEINQTIKTQLVQFLLNGGKGENVPIERLVLNRTLNKEKFVKQIPKGAFNLVKVAGNQHIYSSSFVFASF